LKSSEKYLFLTCVLAHFNSKKQPGIMNILGIGNALVDIMTRLEDDALLNHFKLPKGSMTLVDWELSNRVHFETGSLKKTKSSGGSAANTIHGLAKLGVNAAYIGKIGKDEMGRFFKKDMEKSSARTILYNSLTDTGRAMALISPDSERTFATYLGAAVELSEEDITSDIFKGYDFLYMEGYLINNLPLFEKALRLAKNHGMRTCVDLASFNIVEQFRENLLPEIESYVDIVFANEEEAKALTGKEPEEALEEIAGMCDIAVVKTGARGSLIKTGNQKFTIQANSVKSIDTTGAGDLFASGFLYGLNKNMPLDICGRIGTLLAGKIIGVIGAKLDQKAWEEIKKEIEIIKS
jgi:sugar/nucleoside kinase (ribokinase family)